MIVHPIGADTDTGSPNGLVPYGRVITRSTLLTNRLERQTSSLNTSEIRKACAHQNTSLLA